MESALFFETVEEIYARVYRELKPQKAIPPISIQYRKYANANSKIRLSAVGLNVRISDLLQTAPAPVQEALASILLGKLFGRKPSLGAFALYQRYLNRSDVRQRLQSVKQQRGRKAITSPRGEHYNLEDIFLELNARYFEGRLARPVLGWSQRPSRRVLGHYDPDHHAIVLTRLLDSSCVPRLLVDYVMFHEMLHILHPPEYRPARRCVHTPDFKRLEKTFEGYREARHNMKQFANEPEGR